MPERFHRGTFDPEFVTLLVRVLREACDAVEAASGETPSDEIRNTLAKAIMEQAEAGVTDSEKLKQRALAALPGSAPAKLKHQS